jgi:2-polyprenyl-3-methyl-5-hydroxy-6-metoxy-1,4-benzoquinol methylase
VSYRERVFERYASVFKAGAAEAPTAAIDRWGDGYGVYLKGWLPESRDAAIADVACGPGWLLRFLARSGYTNLAGVDVSAEQVALARRHAPEVECGDVLAFLQKRPSGFDLVTGVDIIEHLTKDEVLDFLDACHGALRPGGRLVLQTPNGESPFFGAVRYGDFTHETCFTPTLLRQLLELAGFADVECRETGPVVRGAASLARAALWRGTRALLRLWNLAETGSPGSGVLTRVFLASAVRPRGVAAVVQRGGDAA